MTGEARSIVLFAGGMAVVSILIAAARRLAIAYDFVARPNPIVRTHRVPVPYLGGAALVLGYTALLAVTSWIASVPLGAEAWARVAGATALAVFGTIDDRRPFGPGVKLAFQIAVCAAYLLAIGERDAGAIAVKLLVLVTLVNAYNLIDVMDGLLCLLAGAAVLGLMAGSAMAAEVRTLELPIAMAAIAAMFLFNRPPARIYNGDAGSLAIGFLIGAWCLAATSGASPSRTLAFAGVVAVPLLELALIVPARVLVKRNPLRGSPDHFALRLQDQLGWTKWQVLTATALVAAAFAVAPWGEARLPRFALLAYASAGLALATIAWWFVWRIPPPRRG